MEVIIRGKNVELMEGLKEQMERKLGKLERHLPGISKAQVDITREKIKSGGEHYIVQVTMDSRGTLLRGEEKAVTVDAAFDSVVDVLNRQIERFKGKFYRKKRTIPLVLQTTVEEPEDDGRVVRLKKFQVKPMTQEEAIEQMELLGHDFFIFADAGSTKINVVYKRKDGRYGLIEPVIG